jgi:glutamate/tyrosine decarboxylase-like PLP-dependent enzyme
LSLQVFGVAAFRAAIGHGFEMAELAERILCERGWVIESSAQMGIVCFRLGRGSDEFHLRLVHQMLEDGYAALTSTNLRGRVVLRMCTINPRTTAKDIEGTIERLDRFAAGVR